MPTLREVTAYGVSKQDWGDARFESWHHLPAKTIYLVNGANGIVFFVYGPRHEYVVDRLRIAPTQLYQYALIHGIDVIDGPPSR